MTDKDTIKFMISLYCKKHHKYPFEECTVCQELYNYASKRVDICPYDRDKVTCSTCKTHCYKTNMQKKIKTVMRYSGPRMILYKPFTAVSHLIKIIKAKNNK